jgi:holo-[acyl-carrier protein] synthase
MAGRRRSGGGGGKAAGPGTGAPERKASVEPPPTTELGIDIIEIARIRAALDRFGTRFAERVLTEAEAAYAGSKPERLAGRWAAKEAVSKVLGLGVRGVGWRDIEIVRLPTGQPAVRLHGRAAARARQLGMGQVAVSISHEQAYAVAVATAVRTAGGAFVFPPDIDTRIDERERRVLGRMAELRGRAAELEAQAAALEARAAELAALEAGMAALEAGMARREEGDG